MAAIRIGHSEDRDVGDPLYIAVLRRDDYDRERHARAFAADRESEAQYQKEAPRDRGRDQGVPGRPYPGGPVMSEGGMNATSDGRYAFDFVEWQAMKRAAAEVGEGPAQLWFDYADDQDLLIVMQPVGSDWRVLRAGLRHARPTQGRPAAGGDAAQSHVEVA